MFASASNYEARSSQSKWRSTKYSLKNKDSAARLTIEEATASREWLDVALREFVIGRTLDIPSKAGALLKLLT